MLKVTNVMMIGILAIPGSMFASISETFTHVTAVQTIPFTEAFSLSGFDPSLGTLTGVVIKLTDDTTPYFRIVNVSGTPQPFTNAIVSIPFTVTVAGWATTIAAIGNLSAGIAPDFINDYLVPTYYGSASTTPTDFLPFETAGGLSVVAATGAGTYGGTSGPSLFFGGGGSAGGTTSITYTYTSSVTTPEPALFCTVGFGLLALAKCRRKRGN